MKDPFQEYIDSLSSREEAVAWVIAHPREGNHIEWATPLDPVTAARYDFHHWVTWMGRPIMDSMLDHYAATGEVRNFAGEEATAFVTEMNALLALYEREKGVRE